MMESKIQNKALLINGSYLPTVGGVENSLRSIANELLCSNWSVDIVCSDEGVYQEIENIDNAIVYRFNKNKGLYLYNAFKLVKKLKTNNYNLVICRNHTLFFVLFFLGFKNIKYIIPGVYFYQNKKEINQGVKAKVKYIANVFIQTLSFNLAKHKYVFSETMKSQVKKFTFRNKKLNSVYPGVDSARFHKLNNDRKRELRELNGIQADKKVILGVGRFVDVKNFEHLISCLSFLPEEYILLLVGGGEHLDKYLEMIERLELKNRVRIISKTVEPEVFYKIADVFCLPSIYEPFGQVLLEASFCELNIVAFDSSIPGIDTATSSIFSIVDSREFFFPVSSSDVKAFADAIFKASIAKGSKIEQIKFNKKYNWATLIERVSLD